MVFINNFPGFNLWEKYVLNVNEPLLSGDPGFVKKSVNSMKFTVILLIDRKCDN